MLQLVLTAKKVLQLARM